uniref:SAM-dependent methyltransferase n=1 Tax=Steinernema glaseri TaxID=37863 RepID=A0A1I7ZND8_9BILA
MERSKTVVCTVGRRNAPGGDDVALWVPRAHEHLALVAREHGDAAALDVEGFAARGHDGLRLVTVLLHRRPERERKTAAAGLRGRRDAAAAAAAGK